MLNSIDSNYEKLNFEIKIKLGVNVEKIGTKKNYNTNLKNKNLIFTPIFGGV